MKRTVPIGRKCKVCERVHMQSERRWQLSKRGLCPVCEGLAGLIEQRMEAARTCGRKPPKRLPPCDLCGGPTEAMLWRPDGDWDFLCIRGCYWCEDCEKEIPSYETCPHNPRKKRRRKKDS